MEFATGDLIYKGINVKDWAALPSMGPATNEAWISMEGEIHFSPEELEDIVLDDFVLADTKEDSIITPITDQIYIEEAEDDLDTDSLIECTKPKILITFITLKFFLRNPEMEKKKFGSE